MRIPNKVGIDHAQSRRRALDDCVWFGPWHLSAPTTPTCAADELVTQVMSLLRYS